MKRLLLFVLLLAICTFHALAYDFTATCPSGQTLYYTIRDASQHTIALVAPNDEHYPPYQGYTSPQGAIELSATVEHEGTTYTLVEIGPFALSNLGRDVHGDIVIPNTVTLIGEQAFSNSYFDGTITIGDHVVTIGKSAFSSTRCHGSVVLPSSVRTLEDNVFQFGENLDGELILNEGLESIGERAFLGCSSLHGELRLPSTLTKLNEFCFANCTGFTGELIIPDGIKSIPASAFSHCSGIEHVSFHDDISAISMDAFDNCSGLSGTLILPSGLKSLGSYAFHSCSGLSGTLTLPSSLKSLGSHAFSFCSGLTHISEESLTRLSISCFEGCTGLTGNIVISQGISCIPMSAFAGCVNIEHVQFPNSLTVIETRAFSGCSGIIGNLQLPDSIREIDMKAFFGCIGLEGRLVLPKSLTYIGEEAFSGCIGFTGNLVIPDKVTKVAQKAFSGCSNIGPNVTIGSSVDNLYQKCFYNTSINHVTFRSMTPPSVPYGMGLGPADCTVPCGTLADYTSQFNDQFTSYEEAMIYRYSVVSNDLTLGDVSILDVPQCVNNAHLIAVANPLPGKAFSHWTVNNTIVEHNHILAFTVGNDCEIMAHFLDGANVEETTIPIDIYPTITSDIIKVEADYLNGLELYDLTGRCVIRSSESQINLSVLPSGCYILRARLAEGEVRRKVIKM